MSDLIDRRAAIDRIRGTGYADQIKENVIMILMCLPSAEPEKVCVVKTTLSEEQIREAFEKAKSEIVQVLPSAQPLVLTCDGCRHVGTYDTDFPCSGCIRREKDYYEQEQ